MVEFVDSTMSGEYRMTIDPHDKDAFRYVPGAQPQMLSAEASPRPGTNEFDGIEKYAKLSGPPKVKFADLEAAVNSTVSYNMLPIKVLNSSIPLTSDTTMNTLTVQIERGGLLFQEHNGKTRAIVDIYGRVSTLSRRVVQTFEDVVELDGPANLPAIYRKAIALQPGKYRLNLAIKDAAGGGLSTYDVALDLPALVPDRLSASSLILADAMEHASMSGIGAGQFVIGDMKVRPRIDAVFERGEKLGIYQRLYNLSLDESTQKTNASVEYRIEESGSHKAVLEFTEDIEKFTSQHVVEKLLPLASVGHGTFLLSLKVDDRISGQTVASSATFTVR